MRLVRRAVLAAALLLLALTLVRIGSGGARELGNVAYAVSTLPWIVATWGVVTLLVALGLLAAVVTGRRVGIVSLATGLLVVPFGAYLHALGHGSGLPLAALGVVIALASAGEVWADRLSS